MTHMMIFFHITFSKESKLIKTCLCYLFFSLYKVVVFVIL